MDTVSDILKAKASRPVLTIDRGENVLNATQLMNEYSVGSIIVTDAGQMCGIFTERDVLRRIVVEQRSPGATKVGDVMTTRVACCFAETSVDDARSMLKSHRVRHLPVVDAHGQLIGLISIGDLNAHLTHAHEVTIHFLNEYLHGRS